MSAPTPAATPTVRTARPHPPTSYPAPRHERPAKAEAPNAVPRESVPAEPALPLVVGVPAGVQVVGAVPVPRWHPTWEPTPAPGFIASSWMSRFRHLLGIGSPAASGSSAVMRSPVEAAVDAYGWGM